jgi:hypothetical protein
MPRGYFGLQINLAIKKPSVHRVSEYHIGLRAMNSEVDFIILVRQYKTRKAKEKTIT